MSPSPPSKETPKTPRKTTIDVMEKLENAGKSSVLPAAGNRRTTADQNRNGSCAGTGSFQQNGVSYEKIVGRKPATRELQSPGTGPFFGGKTHLPGNGRPKTWTCPLRAGLCSSPDGSGTCPFGEKTYFTRRSSAENPGPVPFPRLTAG